MLIGWDSLIETKTGYKNIRDIQVGTILPGCRIQGMEQIKMPAVHVTMESGISFTASCMTLLSDIDMVAADIMKGTELPVHRGMHFASVKMDRVNRVGKLQCYALGLLYAQSRNHRDTFIMTNAQRDIVCRTCGVKTRKVETDAPEPYMGISLGMTSKSRFQIPGNYDEYIRIVAVSSQACVRGFTQGIIDSYTTKITPEGWDIGFSDSLVALIIRRAGGVGTTINNHLVITGGIAGLTKGKYHPRCDIHYAEKEIVLDRVSSVEDIGPCDMIHVISEDEGTVLCNGVRLCVGGY